MLHTATSFLKPSCRSQTVNSRKACPAPGSPSLRQKITVHQLNFYYEDGQRALKDVSVPIYEHHVTAFIGPSGCGKSTLLRVFNRMYDLHDGQRVDGEVLLDGKDILANHHGLERLRARIGMVFQKPAPFPMSVYQNVAFGVGLHWRLTRAEMDTEVEAALRRAALWEEVKDTLHKQALPAFRWPAAASVHRPRHCPSAGRAVARRAAFLHRPLVVGQDRADDRRTRK